MVTHRSTNLAVSCLCMPERTGWPVFNCLWPYVLTLDNEIIIILRNPYFVAPIEGTNCDYVGDMDGFSYVFANATPPAYTPMINLIRISHSHHIRRDPQPQGKLVMLCSQCSISPCDI